MVKFFYSYDHRKWSVGTEHHFVLDSKKKPYVVELYPQILIVKPELIKSRILTKESVHDSKVLNIAKTFYDMREAIVYTNVFFDLSQTDVMSKMIRRYGSDVLKVRLPDGHFVKVSTILKESNESQN